MFRRQNDAKIIPIGLFGNGFDELVVEVSHTEPIVSRIRFSGSAPTLLGRIGFQAVTRRPVPNRPEIGGKTRETGHSREGQE